MVMHMIKTKKRKKKVYLVKRVFIDEEGIDCVTIEAVCKTNKKACKFAQDMEADMSKMARDRTSFSVLTYNLI